MKFRLGFLLFLAVYLSGCVAPPTKVIELRVGRPFDEVAAGVEEFLSLGVARRATFFKDGVRIITRRPTPTVALIELRRYAGDIGTQPAFFRVELYSEGRATRVAIWEGDFAFASQEKVAERLRAFLSDQ